jgi:hypothetical protein
MNPYEDADDVQDPNLGAACAVEPASSPAVAAAPDLADGDTNLTEMLDWDSDSSDNGL